MSVCTFFGHRNAPENIISELQKIITDLIEKNDVNHFYVGNNGNFDLMVKKVLDEELLCRQGIKYEVVLAYLPKNNEKEIEHSIFPEGQESVPPKYAILRRNMWMIERSDYVVTYVTKTHGGAAKSKEMAEKKNKKIIEIK